MTTLCLRSAAPFVHLGFAEALVLTRYVYVIVVPAAFLLNVWCVGFQLL